VSKSSVALSHSCWIFCTRTIEMFTMSATSLIFDPAVSQHDVMGSVDRFLNSIGRPERSSLKTDVRPRVVKFVIPRYLTVVVEGPRKRHAASLWFPRAPSHPGQEIESLACTVVSPPAVSTNMEIRNLSKVVVEITELRDQRVWHFDKHRFQKITSNV